MDEPMHVRPFVREAGWELPSSLDALVAPNDPVRFVAAYIDGFTDVDWQSLGIRWQEGGRGAHGYHPAILLSAWIWGFMTGVRSSRRLEAACRDRLSLVWLTGNQHPDHNTLWRFYEAHRAGMRYLLTHSVHVAIRAGLVDLAVQAVDGTTLVASAARERSYSSAKLERLYERIAQAIADLEAQNATDAGSPPPRLPPELEDAQALAERVRHARETTEPDRSINLTDADAHLMKTRGGVVPGYNGQAMVSPLLEQVAGSSGRLITAAALTTEPTDHGQLLPVADAARATTGQQTPLILADGGYHSGPTLAGCRDRGMRVLMPEAQQQKVTGAYHRDQFTYDRATDTYRCPQGQTLHAGSTKQREGYTVRMYRAKASVCRGCPAFGSCTTDATHGRALEVTEYEALRVTHRQQMATAEAKTRYAQRKELPEPVFGIIKEQQGGRRLLLRGAENARAEWLLLAATFNLRTLARIWFHRPEVVLSG
jgi:transposase